MATDIATLKALYIADTSNFERGNKRVQDGLAYTKSKADVASQAIKNFSQQLTSVNFSAFTRGMNSMLGSMTLAKTKAQDTATGIGVFHQSIKNMLDVSGDKNKILNLQTGITGTGDSANDSATGVGVLSQSVKNMLDVSGDKNNISNLQTGITATGGAANDAATQVGAFGQNVKNMLDISGSNNNIQIIVSGIGDVRDNANVATTQIKKLGESARKIDFSPVLKAIGSIKKAVTGFQKEVIRVIRAIFEHNGELFDRMAATLDRIWSKLDEISKIKIPDIKFPPPPEKTWGESIYGWIVEVKNWVKDLLGITNSTLSIIDKFKDVGVEVADITLQIAGLGLQLIGTATLFEGLTKKSGSVDFGKLNASIGILDTSIQNLTKSVDALHKALKEGSKDAATGTQTSWDTIKGIFDGGFKQAKNTVNLVDALLKGDWGKAWGAAKDIVSTAFENIKRVLGGAGPATSGAVTDVRDVLGTAKNTVRGDGEAIGFNITEGLRAALYAGADRVVDAINYLIRLIPEKIRNYLGINSPSKVVADIMIGVPEGAAKGINAGTPQVKTAVKGMVDLVGKGIKGLADESSSYAKELSENLGGAIDDIIKRLGKLKGAIAGTKLKKISDLKGILKKIGVIVEKTKPTMLERLKNYANDSSLISYFDELAKSIGKTREELTQLIESAHKLKFPPALKEVLAGVGGGGLTGRSHTGSGSGSGGGIGEEPDTKALLRPSLIKKSEDALKVYTQAVNALYKPKTLVDIEKIHESFKDPKVLGELMKRAHGLGLTTKQLAKLVVMNAKVKNGSANMWESLQVGLERFRESLPTVKQQLTDVMINLPQQAVGIFTAAFDKWDGTLKGFFKSVAKGFGNLAKSIIKDLIKMIIQATILAAIKAAMGMGSFGDNFKSGMGFGKAGGGLIDTGSGGGGSNAIAAAAADGGMIRGPGTGTSDSILTRLSNGEFVVKAKAVSKFGIGLFESLNNMAFPQFAMAGARAGGGPVSGGSPYIVGEQGWEMFVPNSNGSIMNQDQLGAMKGGDKTVNNITINASKDGSLATPKSRRQTAEAMTAALRRYSKA